MKYEDYNSTECQYDELILRGVCSSNPNISAHQETIIMFLKELAYYLLELKKLGAQNETIKEHILNAISGIITNIDYNQKEFKNLVQELAQDLLQAKSLYAKMSEKEGLEQKFIKTHFRNLNNLLITDIIKKGEKNYIKRHTEATPNQKNIFDILVAIIKRFCFKIIQTKSYNKDYNEAYNNILELLNILNEEEINIEEIKNIIEKSNQKYLELVHSLYKIQEEYHGERELVNIPFSPRNGKAILVSGIDLTQLDAVLKATENRGVDVYTHGMTMLMAHTLSNFRQYPHLVGHFGKGSESSLFDFAAFPGAVLMTKYLFQKIDYLYRGRIFTTDSFAPNGIIKIEDGNFEPLIQAALQAKGFTKQEQEVIYKVGFRQQEIENKIEDIIKKMQNNEIRHLYFIGILHSFSEYKDYFDKFMKILPKDCYAISLSYEKNEENILHIDSFYDYLLIYRIFEDIKKFKDIKDLKITVFITSCDQYTVTNIINFKNLGIKSIYLCDCIPTLLNPGMVETIMKMFDIKRFTNPQDDLNETLNE